MWCCRASRPRPGRHRGAGPGQHPGRPTEIRPTVRELQPPWPGAGERESWRRGWPKRRRLASLGRLASGIAHEVNNPLGGMLNARRHAAQARRDAGTPAGPRPSGARPHRHRQRRPRRAGGLRPGSPSTGCAARSTTCGSCCSTRSRRQATGVANELPGEVAVDGVPGPPDGAQPLLNACAASPGRRGRASGAGRRSGRDSIAIEDHGRAARECPAFLASRRAPGADRDARSRPLDRVSALTPPRGRIEAGVDPAGRRAGSRSRWSGSGGSMPVA